MVRYMIFRNIYWMIPHQLGITSLVLLLALAANISPRLRLEANKRLLVPITALVAGGQLVHVYKVLCR